MDSHNTSLQTAGRQADGRQRCQRCRTA